MTTASPKDRSHESIINDALARLLRERCGLSAVAETLHSGRRPDIIVRLSEGPVILETEFEPALTVEADALSRLAMEIDRQEAFENVFAVTVPEKLRSTSSTALVRAPGHCDASMAGVAHRRNFPSVTLSGPAIVSGTARPRADDDATSRLSR